MIVLLSLLLACDLTPPPPPREARPKPPAKEASDKRIPDAAMTDTGVWEGGGSLIGDILYTPEHPTAFDDVQVKLDITRTPGMDIDYQWRVNGRTLLSAKTDTLRQTSFSKGDMVQVSILIEKKGRKASKDGPELQIGNAPPRILTRTDSLTKLDGFRVRAQDPDGGTVIYRLDAAPPGLTMGERTGVFRYAPSKSAEGGRHQIKVVVADEDGGESEWRLAVTIRGGSESKEAKARRAKSKADWEADRDAKKAKRGKRGKTVEERQ
jgi:hypothetical protein